MDRSSAKGGKTLVVCQRGSLFFLLAAEVNRFQRKTTIENVCVYLSCLLFFSGLVTNSLVTIDTPTHSPSPMSQPTPPPLLNVPTAAAFAPLSRFSVSSGQPLQPHQSFLYELEPRATCIEVLSLFAACEGELPPSRVPKNFHVVLDPRSFFSSCRTCRMGVTPEVT